MRMSGFLLGGFLGAAVALYVAKNKPAVMAGLNWAMASDRVGNMLRAARSLMGAASTVKEAGAGREENGECGMKKGTGGNAER